MAVPGQTPGESEYCWGPGMFPNPQVDYERGVVGARAPHATDKDVLAGGGTSHDQLRQLAAYKRLNSAATGEDIDEMFTSAGNPDRFGPNPPLVQTPPDTVWPDPDLEPVAEFERRW